MKELSVQRKIKKVKTLRSDEEILSGVYSKEVLIKGSGGIPDKIMQHSQYKQLEGAAATLEVLLDIRRILVGDSHWATLPQSKKITKKV